ncbi:MAG: hypothetical protein HQL64_15380 [Magnetococcales bacterium]|nr:hypothetical protein [Magnetococcales bacterium]
MRGSLLFPPVLLILPLLAGCAFAPSGPSILAMPRSGRSFDQFRVDDADCRSYAQLQSGGSGAIDPGVASAAVGTVVGAVAGAAINGHRGAGVGAGAGLLAGSLFGLESNHNSAYVAQRSYDHAYIQCMYAKGHQVPVPVGVVQSLPMPTYQINSTPSGVGYPPPPPSDDAMPPPPPGYTTPPPLYP